MRGEEVARYWRFVRNGIGEGILRLAWGGGGKILEVYERRDWRGDIGNYVGRMLQDIGGV